MSQSHGVCWFRRDPPAPLIPRVTSHRPRLLLRVLWNIWVGKVWENIPALLVGQAFPSCPKELSQDELPHHLQVQKNSEIQNPEKLIVSVPDNGFWKAGAAPLPVSHCSLPSGFPNLQPWPWNVSSGAAKSSPAPASAKATDGIQGSGSGMLLHAASVSFSPP